MTKNCRLSTEKILGREMVDIILTTKSPHRQNAQGRADLLSDLDAGEIKVDAWHEKVTALKLGATHLPSDGFDVLLQNGWKIECKTGSVGPKGSRKNLEVLVPLSPAKKDSNEIIISAVSTNGLSYHWSIPTGFCYKKDGSFNKSINIGFDDQGFPKAKSKWEKFRCQTLEDAIAGRRINGTTQKRI
jgi:hypothetical protein